MKRILQWIGAIICKYRGHKRGKCIAIVGTDRFIGCPRCKTTWKRKPRAKK